MSRRRVLGALAGAALLGAMRRNSRAPMGYGGPSMGYRRRRGGGFLGILLILAAGYFGSQHLPKDQAPVPTQNITGRVQHVIDGDTFYLQGTSIRLWGIDAPERETAQGPDSTRTLQLLVRGRAVDCMPVSRSHDRLVASCTTNGRDLSQAMVRLGWARDLPNKSGHRYAQDEADARQARRGIWKAATN